MTTLRTLLLDTRDGEWGKGEAASDRVEMRVIRGTDFPSVREGQVASVPTRYLEQRHADRKRLRPWDIIIETAGGSPDRPTGRTVLLTPKTFERLGRDVTCASFARFLRVDPELANPSFVFWLLQHHYERRDLLQYHTQHTGVARFQFTTFSNGFDFELPSLDTQHRVASVLSVYDELIEVNRRRVAVLEEIARGLFEEWFVRFRFPGHETVPLIDTPDGPLPQGWSFRLMGEVADINAASLKAAKAPDEIGYIDIASVSPGQIDAVNWMAFSEAPGRARRIVRDGSILWSNVRPNRRSHALVLDPAPNTIASTGFTVLDATAASFAYIYQWVTTESFVGYLVGNAGGAAYPAVTAATFERASVLMPDPALMDRFTAFATPMMRMAATLRASNERLAASRDLLLPRLMSGQLSVEAAEKELEFA